MCSTPTRSYIIPLLAVSCRSYCFFFIFAALHQRFVVSRWGKTDAPARWYTVQAFPISFHISGIKEMNLIGKLTRIRNKWGMNSHRNFFEKVIYWGYVFNNDTSYFQSNCSFGFLRSCCWALKWPCKVILLHVVIYFLDEKCNFEMLFLLLSPKSR